MAIALLLNRWFNYASFALGEIKMIKSVLAASEGGPDATMSFSLAARVAQVFGATVDALHLPANPTGMTGGLAMGGEAMPLLMEWDDKRLDERAKQSAMAFKDVL